MSVNCYDCCLGACRRDAVQQLETPAAPGASFPALLGPLVTLGALSSRQIYSHTYKAETARWGGRMPMFGASSVTAKAALAAVELSDFHRQLAGTGVCSPMIKLWI